MGLQDQLTAAKADLARANDPETQVRIENEIAELDIRLIAAAEGITPNELVSEWAAQDKENA